MFVIIILITSRLGKICGQPVCSIIPTLHYFISVSHTLYGKGLLVANGTDLCMLDIRVITGHESDARCFLSWKHNITHLAVDANQNKIYFTDDVSRRIQKHDIVLNVTSIIATTSSVSGINMLFSKNLIIRFMFSPRKIYLKPLYCVS